MHHFEAVIFLKLYMQRGLIQQLGKVVAYMYTCNVCTCRHVRSLPWLWLWIPLITVYVVNTYCAQHWFTVIHWTLTIHLIMITFNDSFQMKNNFTNSLIACTSTHRHTHLTDYHVSVFSYYQCKAYHFSSENL